MTTSSSLLRAKEGLPRGVQGAADPRFATVTRIFAGLFPARRFGGGALAVYIDGKPVVDIWTGWSDRGGEVARPLNTDGLHLGRPPAGSPTKVAQILAPQNARPNPVFDFVAPKLAGLPFSGALGSMYIPGIKSLVQGDIPFLDGEVPAANGFVTGRGLARMYAAVANGGVIDGEEFLSRELADGLIGTPKVWPDLNLVVPMPFHLGYHESPIPGLLKGFGHIGLGGTLGWADPSTGSAFGFVHNRPLTPVLLDMGSFAGLAKPLRNAIAAARGNGAMSVPRYGATYHDPAARNGAPRSEWWGDASSIPGLRGPFGYVEGSACI